MFQPRSNHIMLIKRFFKLAICLSQFASFSSDLDYIIKDIYL